MKKKIDYSPLVEKIRDYGINRFYMDSGIGGSMDFLYRLEEGRPITLKSLNRCCEFFGCDIWDLIKEVDDD